MSRPPATGPIRFVAGEFLHGPRERPDVIAKIHGAYKTTATLVANGRRMVACWNACLGISTEVLELYGLEEARKYGPEYERRKRDRITNEAVELIAAMEAQERLTPPDGED